MPTVVKSLSGVGWVQAGITGGLGPISGWSGGDVPGPVVSVIFRVTQRDVLNEVTVIIWSHGSINDSPVFNSETGEYDISDANVLTYIPEVAYPNRWVGVSGFIDYDNGILAAKMGVSTSSQNLTGGPFDFEVWLQYKDPEDPDDWFNPGPSETSNIDHVESDSIDSPGDKDETFTWDVPVEDLVGTVILRDNVVIAVLGPNVTTYRDTVIPGNPYVYKFRNYYVNGDGISPPIIYPPITPEGTPAVIPLITMTMGGEIDFGGAPSIAMIVNPSGIYGLIPNLTHDTLYERIPEITSVNVKIPDPFVKLGFLPED